MLTIRDFRFGDADYEGSVRLRNTLFVDRVISAEYLLDLDKKRHPTAQSCDLIAEQDGKIVGVGHLTQGFSRFHPHKFDCELLIDPDYQNQGVGTVLWQQLETFLLEHDPILVRTRVREYHPNGLRFAEKQGFGEQMRNWENKLTLTDADLSDWDAVMTQIAEQGVTIRPFSDFLDDPAANMRLHLCVWDCLQDVPLTEPLAWIDHADWVTNYRHSANMLPDANFLAIAPDGNWVGISQLRRESDGDELRTGLTGVKRHWRRKGVALALKLHAIKYAQAQGATVITTQNATTNEGMLAINKALGFELQPAEILMAKTYRPDVEKPDA